MSITDREYLNKAIIEDVTYIINNDYIRVDTPCTLFCNAKRVKIKFTKNELIQLYSNVLKLAKSQGVKISYKNKYKSYINDNYELYLSEVNQYSNMFDKLLEAFKQVKNRGLHYGTTDDIILHQAHEIQNNYLKIYLSNTAYSNISDIYNSLNKLYNELQNDKESHYIKIVL